MKLTLRRKIALTLLALICGALPFVLTREQYEERTLTARFMGFTNTSPNETMAIIRFPSVHPRPPSPSQTFFYMPTYDVELHVNYRDRDGALGTRKISERVGITQRRPLGETDLLVPVPEGTVSMEFIGSEGILNHYVDNTLLGWSPPAPKRRHWKFEIAPISVGSTNDMVPPLK